MRNYARAQKVTCEGYESNCINITSVFDANRDYTHNRIPHSSGLMIHWIDDVLGHDKTVMIGNKDLDLGSVPERLRDDHGLADFVLINDDGSKNGNYGGICW
jgi:hypothetical protein